ncbi:Ig-like domain-containing protein [Amycolatopsis sp. cg5]|uniref:Ig-like domain-containing protein n=1 Tax=Amycolatopsis sp. cg5 TaxID=3238802 RepID=UPI0035240289
MCVLDVPTAEAAETEPAGLAGTMLGGALRTLEPEPDFLIDLVSSAELLDWRGANPTAAQTVLTGHLTAIRQKADTAVPETIRKHASDELMGAALSGVLGAPAAVVGPNVRGLQAAYAGRDVTPLSARIEDRLSDRLPDYIWSEAFNTAQNTVWQAVSSAARADASFAAGWNTVLGNRVAVDVMASPVELGKIPALQAKLDLPTLMHLEAPNEVRAAATAKFKDLVDQTYAERKQMFDDYTVSAKTPPAQGDKAAADADKGEKERQKYINAGKTALDVVSLFFKAIGDDSDAKDVAKFASGVLAIATDLNKLVASAQAINEVFSLATVAFTGNVLGMVGTLTSLLAGLGGQSTDQVILDQIKKLREQIDKLRTEMHARFDEIDTRLNAVYQGLSDQLGELWKGVAYVKSNVTQIGENLSHLEQQMQVAGKMQLAATAGLYLQDTWVNANLLIDYTANHPGRQVTYPQYENAENLYYTGATQTATEPGFVVPRTVTGIDDGTVTDALANYGPDGMIRYLSSYAQAAYDDKFPVVGPMLGNPDTWRIAATAYDKLSSQNPDLATQINPNRARDVLGAGLAIRDAALKFSTPAAGGRPNKLFEALPTDYLSRLATFFRKLRPQQDIITGGKYQLFGDTEQHTDNRTDLKKVPQVPVCGETSDAHRILTPSTVDGTKLPAPEMFVRNLLPQLDNWDVCYTPAWENVQTVKTRGQCEGEGRYYPCSIATTTGDLNVTFTETWPVDGAQRKDVRTTSAHVSNGMQIQRCETLDYGGTGSCPPPIKALDPVLQNWQAKFLKVFQDEGQSLLNADQLSALRVKVADFLRQHQAAYYTSISDMVAHNLADNVNVGVQLLGAYTQLGFPRAWQSDTTLHQLLVGDNGLPDSDPAKGNLIGNAFAKAAANLLAGKNAREDNLYDQSLNGVCPQLQGVDASDPYLNCLAATASLRVEQLKQRIRDQFRYRYEGADQTLPDTQRVLQHLWTTTKQIRPNADLGAQVDDIPVPGPREESWRSASVVGENGNAQYAPSMVSLNGKQYTMYVSGGDIYVAASADGYRWDPPVRLPANAPVASEPSIAAFGGHLIVLYKGTQDKRTLTSDDGVHWTDRAGGTGDPGGALNPKMTVFDGKLYAVSRGGADNRDIYVSSSTDGASWAPYQQVMIGVKTDTAPTLAAYNGLLLMAWTDDSSVKLASSPFGTGTWNVRSTVVAQKASAPSITTLGGRIYVSWRNYGNIAPELDLVSSQDGITWTTPALILVRNRIDTPPNLTTFANRLQLTWRSPDSDRILTSTSLTLPDTSPAAPVANDNRYVLDGQIVQGNVLYNDTGIGLTVVGTSDIVNGKMKIYANGDFTFTPSAGVTYAAFKYTLMDGLGRTATAQVTMNQLSSPPPTPPSSQ